MTLFRLTTWISWPRCKQLPQAWSQPPPRFALQLQPVPSLQEPKLQSRVSQSQPYRVSSSRLGSHWGPSDRHGELPASLSCSKGLPQRRPSWAPCGRQLLRRPTCTP